MGVSPSLFYRYSLPSPFSGRAGGGAEATLQYRRRLPPYRTLRYRFARNDQRSPEPRYRGYILNAMSSEISGNGTVTRPSWAKTCAEKSVFSPVCVS